MLVCPASTPRERRSRLGVGESARPRAAGAQGLVQRGLLAASTAIAAPCASASGFFSAASGRSELVRFFPPQRGRHSHLGAQPEAVRARAVPSAPARWLRLCGSGAF